VLAAHDDRGVGQSPLDVLDELHDRGPLVGEQRRDADDLAVGRDAGGDLIEAEADEVAAEVARVPLGRAHHGVDDVDPMAGPLDGARDVGQAERRRDRQARESEGLDRGRSNEANRPAIADVGHRGPRSLPSLR
jgi:hypothetical protein